MKPDALRPVACRGRRRFIGAGMAATVCAAAGNAWAREDYPAKPVTVVVPYAPGRQGDMFARLVGERLAHARGQPFIIDNRPGATGALGARRVANARGDGYTLLLGQTGEMAVNGSAMKNPGYQAMEDFRGVALVGNTPLIMAAPAGAPFNTLAELVHLARAKPGSVSYASSGTATPGHLAAAALALGTRTEMAHIPYKGAGQAITDLIGAQVQFFFSSASAIAAHMKGGRVKALAVSSPRRMAALPQVPTVAEAAVPGFDFELWGGFFAPRRTPDAIVALLNAQINEIIVAPAMRARLEADGSAVEALTPERFDAFVRSKNGKYARLIETVGVHTD
ncbi:Bug family tripartite tricarboxylate transporter substrate binding protein [Verminephrobacter eiseniae]|uniref:Bug family tripartite tricarboxylate transporter substrate binding protein n=1 Tax=Verminephrobacter eiseniae TaxID=364317 RepID=UPI0022378404|nr:tripartite tricarboxylate transporter substrate-binding protein [Verminephrobacter eiseniae]MCW5236158.1 tripartite tricarboxylate transporter substrate binding protein [Verminephrobacter eiseniae]